MTSRVSALPASRSLLETVRAAAPSIIEIAAPVPIARISMVTMTSISVKPRSPVQT